MIWILAVGLRLTVRRQVYITGGWSVYKLTWKKETENVNTGKLIISYSEIELETLVISINMKELHSFHKLI